MPALVSQLNLSQDLSIIFRFAETFAIRAHNMVVNLGHAKFMVFDKGRRLRGRKTGAFVGSSISEGLCKSL